uniref:Uncharacterized protein n=1 Tax=Physcomitrium patens TaxID=3218 RepID=A0A2K1J0C9_PHYPA|nr:hypothetical protein PHYPA_022882 [Physcomitrium patens]
MTDHLPWAGASRSSVMVTHQRFGIQPHYCNARSLSDRVVMRRGQPCSHLLQRGLRVPTGNQPSL